jgi:transcriptional regulator with XRE-family HTH domain
MEQEEFLIELGHKIKVARIDQKLSREKLAEMVDFPPSYIGYIERGDVSHTTYKFMKIVKALDLDINTLTQDLLNKI